MKKFNITLILSVLFFVCRAQEEKQIDIDHDETEATYRAFGEKISAQDALDVFELSETYAKLSDADTVRTKFRATVTDVCKAKGCWMKLQLEDGQEAMVRFKDYGFFMPKDIEGREVVVDGLAFVDEMSVEQQKHYAKDGGESDDELAKIRTAKKTYGFEADGVLLMDQ